MQQFPVLPAPIRPIGIDAEYKTLVTEFETGAEQRRQLWVFPRRTVSLNFRPRQSGTETLWQFYCGRKGRYEPFWFVFPYAEAHTDEYVGKGYASATIFNLPSVSTDSGTLMVYVNGVLTAVTFLSGGGDAGADRIQFSTAPAAGATITAAFTGRLRLKVRFNEDKMKKEQFEYFLYNIGLSLREVR